MKVILDTTFLMAPGMFNVDIFTEISQLLPGCSFAIMRGSPLELAKLKIKGSAKEKAAAKIGLELIEVKNLEILEGEEYVDAAILSLVQDSKDYVVATGDTELKKKLVALKVPVVVLRQKKYVELVRDV